MRFLFNFMGFDVSIDLPSEEQIKIFSRNPAAGEQSCQDILATLEQRLKEGIDLKQIK